MLGARVDTRCADNSCEGIRNSRAALRFDGTGVHWDFAMSTPRFQTLTSTNSNFSRSAGNQSVSEVLGVFVIDAEGKIVATNEGARQLWAASREVLTGREFTTLFRHESVSTVTALGEAMDWRTLRRLGLEAWVTLAAEACDGTRQEVRMRVERAVGGAGSYIATVARDQRGS